MTHRGTPVRQSGMRAHNLAVLLRHVAASAYAPSRASLAAATGLTRATVSALVDDLVAGGLLADAEPVPRSGAGRPAVGLRLAADGAAGLGCEINVDYLAACVVDLTGAVRHRLVEHADQRPAGPTAALAAVGALAATARRRAAADGLAVAGAALAVPGLVAADGVVRRAPNLGWHDVDAAARLRARPDLADLPVSVDNEANLAALGELWSAPDPTGSFVHISGEIGIGAGIVLDGALYRGARGFGGEVGHVPVHPDGPVCRCGARGCLERYAGQEAILRAAGIPPTGTDDALDLLAVRAGSGDADALAALAAAGSALGTVVATVVNLLDIGTVVLGGCYATLLPWLRAPMERELADRVLTAGWAPVHLRASALGGDAAMIGAGGAVVRAVLDDPAGWLATRRRQPDRV